MLVVVFVVTPQTPVTGTENETTLAMGASVPTTKAEPVTVGVTGLLTTLLLAQPAGHERGGCDECDGQMLAVRLQFHVRCLSVPLSLLSATSCLIWG